MNIETMFNKSSSISQTILPVVFGHFPSGCATKQFVHYGQVIHSKQFRKFDYGIVQNFIKYNSFSPPEYNLTNVNAKIVLYYVKNDGIILSSHVERLKKQLPNVVESNLLQDSFFNHVDYIWGKTMRPIYYKIIEDMKNKYVA